MAYDYEKRILASSKRMERNLLKYPYNNQKIEKRSLSKRDKEILYMNANHKCQNPYCKKKIEQREMNIGHKTAFSRGGKTTLKNAVCLCWSCNKLQGTDSWERFLKKQGIARNQAKPREKKIKKLKTKKSIKRKSQGTNMLGIREFKPQKFDWGI